MAKRIIVRDVPILSLEESSYYVDTGALSENEGRHQGQVMGIKLILPNINGLAVDSISFMNYETMDDGEPYYSPIWSTTNVTIPSETGDYVGVYVQVNPKIPLVYGEKVYAVLSGNFGENSTATVVVYYDPDTPYRTMARV